MIGIVDYGVGNVLAFANMYKRMNILCQVIATEADLSAVDKVILPGVGSFDFAMSKLNDSGLRGALESAVMEDDVPLLGVCVGMQMLADESDEGELPGLAWISGSVRRFSLSEDGKQIRAPHMGWNNLTISRDTSLLRNLHDDAWFYYLHSYYFECADPAHELARCDYGMKFSCAVNRDNIYGVQFHPEKSHDYGAKLLRNFAEC